MKDVTQGGLGARIVITGATGFIGSNLARVFLEHGDHVFALVRPGSRHRDALPVHDNLTTVECDLDHVPDCIPAIGRADAFLHLGWGGVSREEMDSPKAVSYTDLDVYKRQAQDPWLRGKVFPS